MKFTQSFDIRRFMVTPDAVRMPHAISNRVLSVLLRVCGYAILVLFPAYCFLMTEYIHFADKARFFTFLVERSAVVLFDLLVLYLIWFCVLCICKKGWISVLVFGFVFGAASFSNYMKHAMTGDYFYPWDLIQQADNIGELLQFITVPFPVLYIGMLLMIAVFVVLVYFSGASLPLGIVFRVPIFCAILFGMLSAVSTPKKVTELLNRNSLYLEDMALQNSNYIYNGFIGAFTVNVLSMGIEKPDGYGVSSIDALLSDCTAQEASDGFSYPDILVVLSESFWDPTLLPGTSFSSDPLSNYRAICAEENTISGRFFTTGFGGGTVRPEFEVLTGLTTDYLPSGCVPWQYITMETESYASVYKKLGYATMAVHPYTSSFYCRKDAFPKIGIDALYFEDEIVSLADSGAFEMHWSGGRIADETFVDAMIYCLEHPEAQDAGGHSPVFLYGISMENHQPYTDKYKSYTIQAENPAFDDASANAVRNFTEGVSHADAALGRLADYIRNRDRDTILIWFGDHLPTLGTGFGAYVQSGMIGTYDEADYERLYATPFLIYANFPLSDSTMLHAGTDNAISSYNLLNAASQLIGAPRSDFMDYLAHYADVLPYYNVRLHKTIDAPASDYVYGHRMLTYDVLAGLRYSYSSAARGD